MTKFCLPCSRAHNFLCSPTACSQGFGPCPSSGTCTCTGAGACDGSSSCTGPYEGTRTSPKDSAW